MLTYFFDLYYQFLDYISTPDFARIILAAQIVSWIVVALLIILIIIILKRSDAAWWVRERVIARDSVSGPRRVNKKWQEILIRLERGDDANLKLAVIEAESIIYDIIKKMRLPGGSLDQWLQQFEKHELPSIDLLWEAHHLRDKIINDPARQISREETEQAIDGYKAALKDLDYLD